MNTTQATESAPLLAVDGLSVGFLTTGFGSSEVLHSVSFDIQSGERLALVGESGSGKSVTALAILRLHDPTMTAYPSGRILFEGRDILRLQDREIRGIRGREIAMIFQEPMTSLNPVYPIGKQLMEPLLLHEGVSQSAARRRMIELLDRTGIVEPHKRFDAFPHMLSGGQRQRVMIAMALACSPKLLIADEPTTALDVTVQAQILELLADLQREFSMAVLLITHDLPLVRYFAQRVCVMRRGELVEKGSVQGVFENPLHGYTRQLLDSQPRRMVSDDAGRVAERARLLEAGPLRCYFPVKAGFFRHTIGEIRAVDNVAIELGQGETLGIVGESGSGKSTLGLCILRLQDCDGQISFDGHRLDQLSSRQLRPLRRDFQIVFQDPYSSLSPRMTVEQILREGLRIHFPDQTAAQHRQRVLKVLDEVGLEEAMLWRYPHEFSGGQRQRIAIARVVVLEPRLILLDEPTSALDVSVQKQVLELLLRLQQHHGISYLFISHDLKVIQAISHRVVVMKDGRIVEAGSTRQLFTSPRQEYTRTLLRAALIAEAGQAAET